MERISEGNAKKPDRRVVRTKRAIRKAFINLLARKEYSRITVKDIAAAAAVDRKTVYNYYSGIYEIREELENDIIRILDSAVSDLDFRKYAQDPRALFETLARILNENMDLYGNILLIDSKSVVIRKFTDVIAAWVRGGLEQSALAAFGEERIGLATTFITSGIMNAWQQWYHSDRRLSSEEMASLIGTLVLVGTKGLLGQM